MRNLDRIKKPSYPSSETSRGSQKSCLFWNYKPGIAQALGQDLRRGSGCSGNALCCALCSRDRVVCEGPEPTSLDLPVSTIKDGKLTQFR